MYYKDNLVRKLAAGVVILSISLGGCGKPGEPEVCFKERCFYVELARTPQEWAKGLMFRKSLGNNKGMLFIFKDEDKHSFWMKNTLIPLDMLWIDKRGEVVFIKKMALPCLEEECPSIHPDKEAKYVLEVNGGIVDDIGLEIGDKAEFDLN